MSRSKKSVPPRVQPQEESYEENSTEDEIIQDTGDDGGLEEVTAARKAVGGGSSNRSKQFRCTICNYVTNVKARYTKHVKYHSMPSIKCDYCDFKTPYKWNLDRHYKNHNGDGSLSCPLCNFTCDIKQSLTVHIQNHHAVLPPNIADLIKQSLGYADAVPSAIEDSKEEYQSQPTIRSSYIPAKTSAIKRRNSSPVRNIGVAATSISNAGRTPILTITRTASPSPEKLRSESGPKMLVSSLRYNCRSCNYTTLSEGDLNRHILRTHQSRRISASSTPSSKRMPSLIPIKPQSVRSAVANASPRKPSQTSPNALEASSSIAINGSLVKHEDAVPTGSGCEESELHRSEHTSDSFEEKLAFLECLALKPNKKVNNISEKNQEESSARESQSPSQAPRSISSSASPKRTSASKGNSISRRRTSFFDKLTQKLAANSNISTTLSKVEVSEDDDSHINEGHGNSSHSSITVTSNSTRCQYCRHRCKSSVDLISHLGQCPVAKSRLEERSGKGEENKVKEERMSNNEEEAGIDDKGRIFVWNNTSSRESKMEEEQSNEREQPLSTEEDLVGYETEPGVGSIHYEGEDQSLEQSRNQDELAVTTSRNVYKCPQNACGFWATTASRFHVHVVGHYNLKPFECSQCSYRSNWRWDITKHIRLKTLRDPNHAKAKVLLTHESGERNYRKYDRYLVSMDVKYSADSKLPDCSTVASKRMDVECSSPGSVVSTPLTSPVTIPGKSNVGGSHTTKLQMPKLTKAPVMNYSGGGVSESSESKEKARLGTFPPSLKPISISPVSLTNAPGSSRSFVEKKMLAGCEIEITPHKMSGGLKDPKIRSPKTVEDKSADRQLQMQVAYDSKTSLKPRKNPLWKCKKCPFKHPVKEVVLLHLRHNHKNCKKDFDEHDSSYNQNNIVISSVDASGKRTEQSFAKLYGSNVKSEVLKCSQCSFMTTELNLFEDHATEHHSSRNTAAFPCAYCSSVFSSRKEFLQHMKMHGSDTNLSPEDQSALTITPEEIHTKPRGAGGTMYKKYRCLECPYVTDSKGQFLYHKQFHIPRESLFKCPKCSYNVSHKHLLHQHIRVHGSGLEHMLQDHEIAGGDDEMMIPSSVVASYETDEEENSSSGNHPTVLVWKNGQPFRMFRCHLCPQVFGKLSDMQDHEEDHNSDTGSVSNGDEAMNLSLKKSRTTSPSGNPKSNSLLKVNYNSPAGNSLSLEAGDFNISSKSVLYFCDECPARFFYEKELRIHHTFHIKNSEFKCQLCSYSARQQNPHLMSHMKVHGSEYQAKTQHLLAKYPKASSVDLDIQSELQIFTPSISITPTSSQGHNGGSAFSDGLNIESGQNTQGSRSKPDASIHCDKCPAKFNTMGSFVQHRNNHGRRTSHTCKYCDYSADSGNNLTLHEILHAGSQITIEPEIKPINVNAGRRKTNNQPSSIGEIDPNHSFGMHHGDGCPDSEVYEGNPEFIYPTYVKNGRVKSKRYKCSKCPSAFEKRDQYRVHIGLHGSDQRYKCTVCDYAVTYYANYIQHLKKHENQPNVDPELLIVKPFSKMKHEPSMNQEVSPSDLQIDSGLEDVPGETDEDSFVNSKRVIRCSRCPYGTTDYSQYQDHLRHHLKLSSDQKQTESSPHKCLFCDFTSPKKSLLRDHISQHFQGNGSTNGNGKNPQSFMFAEDVEIFLKQGTGKEEKVFCEKENYNERRESNESERHCSIITISGKSNGGSIIDLRRGLPVSMLNTVDDSE